MSILNYIEQMKDMYEGERIGTPTKEVTQYGRRIYETPEGNVSEKSTTFFLNGKWMNVPSIHEGRAFTDDQLRRMIKEGTIQPTSVHGSRIEAEAAAASRSDMMKSHTKGFAEGQLVRNTVDGSRPGYQGKRVYPSPDIDKFSDALLDAYAKDDITKIVESGKSTKFANVITAIKSGKYKGATLAKIMKNTGLDEETIFNLFDDRDAYIDLAREGHGGTKPRAGDFYKKAENWIIKNSPRYADPNKFKKAFIRTFGTNNDLIKTLKRLDVGERRKMTSVPFSPWFKETILGTQQKFSQPGYNYNQLNNIFKTAIYTNNPNVRKNITKEIKRLLSMPMTKGGKFDIRDEIKSSKIFKQFGFDKQIRGPIARLLANEITKSVIIPGSGEKVLGQISAFRDPYLPTEQLVKYLSDRVDPKYKSMFDETAKAVSHAVKQKWPEAKKALNIADDIMFDHKISRELVKLGYADEIEYIKLNPTSKEFNTRIKNPQFDQKIIKLAHDWKKATTVDAKAKIVGDMNILKDKFSKKYGNYLDDVKITPDKTGKPIFSSKTPVVTKKTDLTKMLETSLQQEKFPTMSKAKQAKFLQLIKTAKTAKGPGKLKALGALLTLGGAGFVASLGFSPTEVKAAEVEASETGVIDKAKSWPVEHPWLTGGAAVGATASTKAGRKLLGKLAGGAFGPTGMAGLWTGFGGVDVKDPWDRAGVAGEALLAPTIVKGTEAVTKGIKNPALRNVSERALNLLMPLKLATKVARIASPIGLISLAGEGIYHAGKKEMAKRAQMSPEELKQYMLEKQSRGWSRMKKAGGGMVGIRKPSAIAPTGGPMAQGLRSLYINDRDY